MKPIVCIFLTCITAAAQSAPNARKLLENVAETYRSARSYDIEAVSAGPILTKAADGSSKPLRNTVRVVYQAPDNYRVEVEGGLTLLYRGDKEYRFSRDGTMSSSMANPYGGPIRVQDLETRRSGAIAMFGISDFTKITNNLLSARVARQEDVEVNGIPVFCWVVEALHGSTTFGAQKATYWIAADHNLVLREVKPMPTRIVDANGQKIPMEHTMTVQKLLWNQEISASLFDIPVAPGMKRPDGTVQPGPNGTVPAVPIGLNGIEGLQRPSGCYEPLYTDEARLAGMETAVRVDYLIDEKGIPVRVHAMNQLGLGLEEMAEACVARWRYSPAMRDGKPIATPSSAVLTFQQHQRVVSLWHLERAAFAAEDGVKRPVFRKVSYPPAPTHFNFTHVSVPLKLTIDERGVPKDIQVAAPADPRFAEGAVEIVAKWRFTPGERNGHPVAVTAEFDMVHGSISRR